MEIEVKDKKVGVIKETSPYNYCSLNGFTGNSVKPLICQPNSVVIIVENNGSGSESDDVDAEVR